MSKGSWLLVTNFFNIEIMGVGGRGEWMIGWQESYNGMGGGGVKGGGEARPPPVP